VHPVYHPSATRALGKRNETHGCSTLSRQLSSPRALLATIAMRQRCNCPERTFPSVPLPGKTWYNGLDDITASS
jgi:hypothetical protein